MNIFPPQISLANNPTIQENTTRLVLLLREFLLNLSDGFPRIQMLRTNFSTIHNRMTTIQFERIVQFRQPLILKFIARILNPPVRLHQNRRSEIFIGIPPVRWTCGATTRAEDAFVHAVEFGTVLACL